MSYGRIWNRQFLSPLLAVLHVDGSAVTTTTARDGLLKGQYVAQIKKGAGGDANLVTIDFERPFGKEPQVLIQEITVDCHARLEAAPTKSQVQIRTLELDGVTAENDADMYVFIFAPEHGNSLEGRYLS